MIEHVSLPPYTIAQTHEGSEDYTVLGDVLVEHVCHSLHHTTNSQRI